MMGWRPRQRLVKEREDWGLEMQEGGPVSMIARDS